MGDDPRDRLAALLDHFSVRAHTFHAGALCGINALEAEEPGITKVNWAADGSIILDITDYE